MAKLHICKGTIEADSCIQLLEQHMLQSRQNVFFRDVLAYFSGTTKSHSAGTTAQLHSKSMQMLNWPAHGQHSPIRSVIEEANCSVLSNLRCKSDRMETFHFQFFNNWCFFSPQTLSLSTQW